MPNSINNWDVGFTLKFVPKWMKVFSPVAEEDSSMITPVSSKVGIQGVIQTYIWHENCKVQSSQTAVLPMYFHIVRWDKPVAEADKGQLLQFQDTIQEYLTSIGIKWEDNQHIIGFGVNDSNTYWHYFQVTSEDMRTWYKYWNMEPLMNKRQKSIVDDATQWAPERGV